ncbi:MAG: DMT family transporter [Alphaproteobacteria bacterium]|nr:DMT family transporter [Alphaproteobacteria bacterium]
MNTPSLLRLILLSAIWGGSFMLTRIGAPVIGPAVLIALRLGLAALFLLGFGAILKKNLGTWKDWKHFAILGFFNSALPFLLFAVAAKTLSASLLSILNATSPIWAAVIGAAWFRTKLSLKSVIGLALGVTGVTLLVGFDTSALQEGAPLAIALVLGAAFCYGIATTYAKTAPKIDSFANAHGCMWAGTLLVLPAVPAFGHTFTPTPEMIALVLAIGILCSGIAYILYFRLIEDVGPTSALTVTFIVPVFGVIWGHIFLDEPIGIATVAGALIVIVGTAMVTGFNLSSLRLRRI